MAIKICSGNAKRVSDRGNGIKNKNAEIILDETKLRQWWLQNVRSLHWKDSDRQKSGTETNAINVSM